MGLGLALFMSLQKSPILARIKTISSLLRVISPLLDTFISHVGKLIVFCLALVFLKQILIGKKFQFTKVDMCRKKHRTNVI